ncbi:MAG: hypothetical protein K2I06_14020 [Ruminococcus sp.]|nr:hypothetical protein [Ruminococcus sp.]
MTAELFENIVSIITMFPPVAVIPVILIIFIIKKSKNKIRLKKFCIVGFFIFTALSVLSEAVLYTDAIDFIESLAKVLGGIFFAMFYYAVQAFCFVSGVTLLVTYIVLTVRKEQDDEQELQEVSSN